MGMSGTTTCPHCQRLLEENEALKGKVASLEAELAKSRKNSGNSSKSPSSDIVKPPRPKRKGKKKRGKGGQPGHDRHQRPPFEPEQINDHVDYTLSSCPDCGGFILPSDSQPRVVQQVELVTKPIEIVEHRGLAYWCPHCQTTHYATIEEAVRRAGLIGPRLTVLVAFLKGGCHCSFSTIRKFLRDVVKVRISRGQLAKLIAKVSASLEPAYELLEKLLPDQTRLNVDETGHKDNGDRMWTWCFRASLFTLFKITPTRGSEVLVDVLGEEFKGVLGCDYFSAYRKYMREFNVLVQFCLAHLIRDIKFLTTHPNKRNQSYGQRLLDAVRELFAVIHRRERMSATRFAGELEDAGNTLCGAAIWRVPNTPEAQNLAKRFEKHGDSYIRFITTPGVEPTNNLAEQAIRFVVLDRHVTQGSRGETGQRWLERIWSVMATCAQQGRSVFDFLFDSVTAYFQGSTPPNLIPIPNTS